MMMDDGEVEDDVDPESDVANILASVQSSVVDGFNNIIQECQLEENSIIDRVVEEYTSELDSNVAEVMDTNTYVGSDIVAQWRCKEVMAPDSTMHYKETLLKSIHHPSGMVLSSTPLSMDRNS
jgi:hypothetical protein